MLKTRIGLALLAGAFLSACGPTLLQVRVSEPGKVNFGSLRRLSIVQTEGRRSAREQLIQEVIGQARTTGHFQVTDRTEEGFTAKIAGRTVQLSGGKAPQAADEIFVRFDVLEWSTGQTMKEVTENVRVTKYDAKGKPYTSSEPQKRMVSVLMGKALLGVTAFNQQGQALLAETEYKGEGEGASDGEAMTMAAKNVVGRLLGDVTPRQVMATLRVDDDDKAQKPIIEVAKGGNLARALEEMRAFATQNPANPSAQYNLGVFLDATGQYKEALDWYTKAAQNSTKDFYAQTKAACAQRLANVDALNR